MQYDSRQISHTNTVSYEVGVLYSFCLHTFFFCSSSSHRNSTGIKPLKRARLGMVIYFYQETFSIHVGFVQQIATMKRYQSCELKYTYFYNLSYALMFYSNQSGIALPTAVTSLANQV